MHPDTLLCEEKKGRLEVKGFCDQQSLAMAKVTFFFPEERQTLQKNPLRLKFL